MPRPRTGLGRTARLIAGAALALGLGTAPGFSQTLPGTAPGLVQTPPSGVPLGATLDSVLAIARRLSPALAARALETEAAQARVMIARSFPDPQLQVMSDNGDRTSGPRLTP